jgi:four helix bundle protein
VFTLADELVLEVYGASQGFPPEERYGLQGQLRRAAVSVPTNIVEGCARRSTRDYLKFMVVAAASASEARYLIDLPARLDFIPAEPAAALVRRYEELIRGLQRLIAVLNPKP